MKNVFTFLSLFILTMLSCESKNEDFKSIEEEGNGLNFLSKKVQVSKLSGNWKL